MAAHITKFRQTLLRSKYVGLDSMCFIYQFAADSQFSPLTHLLFELMEKKKITAVTSSVSVIETFVLPESRGDQFLLSEYEKVFLNLPGLAIVPIDWPVSRLAAKLRAQYPKIRIPDAVQLSAAMFNGCSVFVTNDVRLKQVKEIKVVLLKEYVS